MVEIVKSKTNKIEDSVSLRFMISKHSREEQLMLNLIHSLNCGKLNKNNNCLNLTIRRFGDIDKILIPFFQKYPIIGQKSLDFQDFCRASKLINRKDHLTIEGLKNLIEIKNGMNTRRL